MLNLNSIHAFKKTISKYLLILIENPLKNPNALRRTIIRLDT